MRDVFARRPWLAGTISALFGSVAVLGMLALMNRSSPVKIQEPASPFAAIDIVKTAKPEAPKPVRPPPKQQPKPRRAAPQPIVGLDSGLSGLSFGMPAFDDDANELGSGLADDDSDLIMTSETVDQAPRPVQQSPMVYPPRAKAQGITGHVRLSVLIGPSGRVEQVRVLEAVPAGVFDDVAVAGVKTWRFEPATYKGEQVRVWATQTVRFQLS